MRRFGALALFAVGLDHLAEYALEHYSAIPTIRTLFVVNFVAATVVAYALVTPAGRLQERATTALRLSGIAVAAGSLVSLLLSEHGSLFGFTESGYRPAIVLAIAFDTAAIAGLAWPSRARGLC